MKGMECLFAAHDFHFRYAAAGAIQRGGGEEAEVACFLRFKGDDLFHGVGAEVAEEVTEDFPTFFFHDPPCDLGLAVVGEVEEVDQRSARAGLQIRCTVDQSGEPCIDDSTCTHGTGL